MKGLLAFGMSIIYCSNAVGFLYEVEKNSSRHFFFDVRSSNNLSAYDFFHRVVFDGAFWLKRASADYVSISILVPLELEGYETIHPNAFFIESIRTLLAKVRSYYYLSNQAWPLRIIFFPQDYVTDSAEDIFLELIDEKSSSLFPYVPYGKDIPCGWLFNKKKSSCSEGGIITKSSIDYLSHSTDEGYAMIELPERMHIKPKDCLRFCISGAAGFIGSTLVKMLLEEGHQVIGIDNFRCSNSHNLKSVVDNPFFYLVTHDISYPIQCNYPIDIVIHLASIPSPVDYYTMPEETLATGLEGTKNMLELARRHGARFLFSSTSEVYGDPRVSPQPESYEGNVDYFGPRSAYDQSKRGAETLIKLYVDRYNIDARIARIFNTYGPGMRLHDGRVITNFIAAALEQKPLMLYGDGMQTRSFGYIEDTVDGLYALSMACFESDEPLSERIFNIGTPIEFSVKDLAYKVQKLSEKYLKISPEIVTVENPDATDPKMRLPDIQKATKRLGFNPQIRLDEGLEKTFLFFLKNYQECV